MANRVTKKIDRAALTLALDQVFKRDPDPGRREQVRAMLDERGWYEAASFAAYHRQCEALRGPLDLKPWQQQPCHIDLRLPEDVATPCGQFPAHARARHFALPPVAAASGGERRAARSNGYRQ
jgi:hypothetical protein